MFVYLCFEARRTRHGEKDVQETEVDRSEDERRQKRREIRIDVNE